MARREASDRAAAAASASLRSDCAASAARGEGQEGRGYEYGMTIYQDESGVRVTPAYTSLRSDEVEHAPGYERYGVRPERIIGFMHCHQNGNPEPSRRINGDIDTLRAWGQWVSGTGVTGNGNGEDGAATDFTIYTYTEDDSTTVRHSDETSRKPCEGR